MEWYYRVFNHAARSNQMFHSIFQKGKAVKKQKVSQTYSAVEEELKQSPHSFVFQRGLVGKNVGRLIRDMRQVMEPFTASGLKVRV